MKIENYKNKSLKMFYLIYVIGVFFKIMLKKNYV